MSSIVTVNLVVLNGERYIRHFLDSVERQTYPHELIEFNILDNGSTDNTKTIIENFKLKIENSSFATFNVIKSKQNLGMWPGQEELLKYSEGECVVASAVDIILDKDFIKNSVEAMKKDKKIGAVQAKTYKYDLVNSEPQLTKVIDTAGFQIFRSRRVVNIGHGEEDKGPFDQARSKQFDFNKQQEIFAVEGAVPVFRKEALESCRISIQNSKFKIQNSEIADSDFVWYGDDLDLAWRMNLLGWKQVFVPKVVAWHDRQTTKSVKKSWSDYITRVPIRRQIPIKKRRLDWRNTRWTLVKNDYIINILKDLPWIFSREVAVLGYAVLFEPEVLKEIPTFFKYIPKMLRKRKEIMKKTLVGPKEFRKWLN